MILLCVEVVQVAAGGMHSVALTAEGEVYTCGVNDEGALGRETSKLCALNPLWSSYCQLQYRVPIRQEHFSEVPEDVPYHGSANHRQLLNQAAVPFTPIKMQASTVCLVSTMYGTNC